jgi:3-phenylpropionate/cinnamic acid dioxygenase small subunit
MTMLRVVPTSIHSARRTRTAEIISLFRDDTPAGAHARLTLEDRSEIDELLSEYASLVDDRRWTELPALFTHEATLKIGRTDLHGRAAISDWATASAAGKPRRSRHQITNLRIHPAGPDRATGTATVVVHVAKEGRRDTFIDMVGELRDEFVRTPAGWRFSRRTVVHIADDG